MGVILAQMKQIASVLFAEIPWEPRRNMDLRPSESQGSESLCYLCFSFGLKKILFVGVMCGDLW